MALGRSKIALYYRPRIFLNNLFVPFRYSPQLLVNDMKFLWQTPFEEENGPLGVTYVQQVSTVVTNLFRLALAFGFAASIACAPVKRAVLLVAERVIENDKPLFALVFGGVAATAKVGAWLVNIL